MGVSNQGLVLIKRFKQQLGFQIVIIKEGFKTGFGFQELRVQMRVRSSIWVLTTVIVSNQNIFKFGFPAWARFEVSNKDWGSKLGCQATVDIQKGVSSLCLSFK